MSPTDRASLGPRGREIAPQSLLSAMRQRREIFQDEETNFYLRAMRVNGANATPTDMVLYTDARTIEAWEEFLHGTQRRLRLDERYSAAVLERQVKRFMIRHRQLLGIIDEDVEWLRASLEMYQ